MIRKASNSTPNDKQILTQITALLSRLFILIPSSLLSIYSQGIRDLMSSDTLSDIYTAILLTYSVFKIIPQTSTKIVLTNQFNLSSIQHLTSSLPIQIPQIPKSKKQLCHHIIATSQLFQPV
jgi:hypothetical protein